MNEATELFILDIESNLNAYEVEQLKGHLFFIKCFYSDLEIEVTLDEITEHGQELTKCEINMVTANNGFHSVIGEFKNLRLAYQIIQQICDGTINVDAPCHISNNYGQ